LNHYSHSPGFQDGKLDYKTKCVDFYAHTVSKAEISYILGWSHDLQKTSLKC